MPFHLGKPILAMICLTAAAAVTSQLTNRAAPSADIEVWTFSEQHWRCFVASGAAPGTVSPLQRFEEDTGRSAQANLVQFRAMNTRLSSLFMSQTGWPECPDVVEIEIGSVGRYFRPPVDEIGLLPLNDFLRRDGWEARLVANRLAPWTKDGQVFGIPIDVHPVMIAYNDELFREAGIDLAQSVTWDQFIADCQAYERYWRAKGVPRRRAFELNQDNATWLLVMLLQRGVNVVDNQDRIWLTDERVVDTLLQYCRMLGGPEAMSVATSGGQEVYATDLTQGYVGAMFAPDWRLRYIRDGAPQLHGKLRVRPLPTFPDSAVRTSTIGGTMIGIPRKARDPELAWRMIEHLYLRPESLRQLMGSTYVLPPLKAAWNDPLLKGSDAYFGGQAVREVIVELADEVPPRYVSAASTVAEAELSMVMIDALAYMRNRGETGLREFIEHGLRRAADSTRRRIEHGRFDDGSIE
jgi:arabinosaccharide transport system substrate-binding protein